jgi:protease I
MAHDKGRDQVLKGKRVAVLMTDGVEQIEYTSPRTFLEQHGAQVVLLAPKGAGESVQGFHHMTPGDKFKVEKNVSEARPNDYDALVLPGGAANPEQLRLSPESIAFIRAFADTDQPIAAICHGPRTLIDAGVAQAKHLTSWPGLQHELRDAGAEWTDDELVIDGRLITSRKPADLPAFNDAILRELLAIDDADAAPSS